jgi:hypothetical protein
MKPAEMKKRPARVEAVALVSSMRSMICDISIRRRRCNHSTDLDDVPDLLSELRLTGGSDDDAWNTQWLSLRSRKEYIPKNEVMLNPIGMAINCGQTAAPGVLALEAKSGALVMRVNMLLKVDEMEMTICQASAEP